MSPCIKICVLNKEKFCLGCKRHISEIQLWNTLPEEVKKEIIESLDERVVEKK